MELLHDLGILHDVGIDKEYLKRTKDQGKDKEVTNRLASN